MGTRRPRSGRRFEQDDEFRQFAAEFLPTLLKGAYLLLRDVDLAEDAVQGTMLKVFRHWNDARSAPKAYSQQTLINVCRDHWRRQSRRPSETPLTDEEPADSSIPFSRALEERDAIEQALETLPKLQREVLVLRFFFDLSVSETATLLNVADGTVKSATSRGLQDLRGVLSRPDEEVKAC